VSRPPAILLVDDDDDYLFVALRAIERTGLRAEVRVARTCAEALAPELGIDGDPRPTPARGSAWCCSTCACREKAGSSCCAACTSPSATRSIPVVVVTFPRIARTTCGKVTSWARNSYVVKRYLAIPPVPTWP
jgi:hypothetical protein